MIYHPILGYWFGLTIQINRAEDQVVRVSGALSILSFFLATAGRADMPYHNIHEGQRIISLVMLASVG